jgi:hypothetical protein
MAERIRRESPVIISRRLTVNSAIWMGLSWTMKPGRSATSKWQHGIGCRARRY